MSDVLKHKTNSPVPSLFELLDSLADLPDAQIKQFIDCLQAERLFIRACLDDARMQGGYDRD
jgi:hypothetical protein